MTAYADSSFISALYLLDPKSVSGAALMRKYAPGVLFSELGRVEVVNAIYQRVFRNEIEASAALLLVHALDSDIETRVLQLRTISESVYTRCLMLTKLWTPQFSTRASDVVHVATAMELKADTFLSFDKRQTELARAEGLSCQNL